MRTQQDQHDPARRLQADEVDTRLFSQHALSDRAPAGNEFAKPRAEVVDQLFALQVASGLWSEANEVIASAIRRKTLPAARARRRRAAVLVEHSRVAEAEGDADTAFARAGEAHNLDPTLVPATLTLARLYKARQRASKAERLVEEAWARAPNPELAAMYGEIISDTDPLARVKKFQRLFSFRPDHPESHIALAEVSLAARLWGEARKHLKAAAGTAPTARVSPSSERLSAKPKPSSASEFDALMKASSSQSPMSSRVNR